ncbi:VOC family protein [Leifsonia sp. 2TAF2]|uniref:VOC family protein n=1 Tax=Leifsonia sp. 2TAF2 TaxID=3233009 RepID=UPI003F9DDC42
MTITTTTHLNFRGGEAREALDFYASVFDGEATAATYEDFGMPAELPDARNVVFGQASSADGFRLMAYDVPVPAAPTEADGRPAADTQAHQSGPTRRENGVTITEQPFFVSVRGTSLDEVSRYWERLTVGATIIEPLAASAWSAGFGMLTDRFGVTWILDVA